METNPNNTDAVYEMSENLVTRPIREKNGNSTTPIVEQPFSGSSMGASRTVVPKEPIHFRYVSVFCFERLTATSRYYKVSYYLFIKVSAR